MRKPGAGSFPRQIEESPFTELPADLTGENCLRGSSGISAIFVDELANCCGSSMILALFVDELAKYKGSSRISAIFVDELANCCGSSVILALFVDELAK